MINTKIPTFLGIMSITVATVTGVLLVNERQSIQTRGKGDNTPRNVRVSNITDTSFAVSWITDDISYGKLKWKENSNTQSLISESSYHTNHSHTVTNAKPSTTYYFEIVSDNQIFDNDKIPWSIRTGVTLPLPQNSHILTGTVIDELGNPVEGALVYATVGGTYPLSTTTSSSGNWLLSLGLARTNDLLNYTKIKPETTLVELSFFTSSMKPTYSKFYLDTVSSGITVILGTGENTVAIPESHKIVPLAEIKIPKSITKESGFGILMEQ